MPSYLSPGVYVEEVSSGSRPIEGQSKRSPLGRESCIAPIEWRDEWPCLAIGGVVPGESFEIESRVEQNLDSSWSIDFGQCSAIPLELQSLRIPKSEDWCNLSERPGFLRIRGQESPTFTVPSSQVLISANP